MPVNYSASYQKKTNAVSSPESPVVLLEISHSGLSEPIRVAKDTQDFPYGVAYVWQPSTAYVVNDIVVPSTYNGHYYQATVGGDSGASEPSFPLSGTVDDNEVTWSEAGVQFKAVAFRIQFPTDPEQGLPRARLAMDNVGRELMAWLEATDGGAGASCRVIVVMRSDPGTIEWEVTMNLADIRARDLEVSGVLGYEDMLNRPGIPFTYRPETAPGLY